MLFLLSAIAVVAALIASVLASPISSEVGTFEKTSIFEKIALPPSGWARNDDVVLDKDFMFMKLRIHLVQHNMPDFHELAMKIATPGHELYGRHLSQSVIDELVAPKDESLDLVMKWLESENLGEHSAVSSRGDSVIVEASISQVERLLKTEYNAFSSSTLNNTVVRTLEYSLPKALKGHVDIVQPTTYFGMRPMRSTISAVRKQPLNTTFGVEGIDAVTGCSGSTITPKCLANLYSFSGVSATQTTGLMGIAGFLEQYPSKSDLSSFLGAHAVFSNSAQTYTCTTVNSGSCPSNPSDPGDEANLDVQYARAITAEIPNTFYSTGGEGPWIGSGTDTNEPYLEFLDYLLGLTDAELPNTLSISYGDDEDTVPLAYADNVCNLFSQLGARGVSVLVASGDSGVGDACTTTSFSQNFPASCPWVTTVGGTSGNSPESAWSGSGGGFSDIFGQPSYQTSAITTWLASTNAKKWASYYNSSGRGYPDVAAQSTDFLIYISGESEYVDGTSCATPTFASVIQLINSNRLEAGKSGLGFLNPWLYSDAKSALTDITTGSNSGCSGEISGAGFTAITGWDPATGLGTPIYTSLLTVSDST